MKTKRQKNIFLIKQVYILSVFLSVFFLHVASVTLATVLIEVESLPRIYMHTARNIYSNGWFQIVSLWKGYGILFLLFGINSKC